MPRLTGNAVTVPVARWLGERLAQPYSYKFASAMASSRRMDPLRAEGLAREDQGWGPRCGGAVWPALAGRMAVWLPPSGAGRMGGIAIAPCARASVPELPSDRSPHSVGGPPLNRPSAASMTHKTRHAGSSPTSGAL